MNFDMERINTYLFNNVHVPFYHRGKVWVDSFYEENTMEAFTIAARTGNVETDLRLTKDCKLICCHDDHDKDSFSKTRIADRIAAYWVDRGFVLFEDVLEKIRGTYFCVDIKDSDYNGWNTGGEAVNELMRILEYHNAFDKVVVCSFHDDVMILLQWKKKYVLPFLVLAFSPKEVKKFMFLRSLCKYRGDIIVAPERIVTKGFIRSAYKIGKPVIVYTIKFNECTLPVNGGIGYLE